MARTATTTAPRLARVAPVTGGVPALDRGLDIIESLGSRSVGLTLSELSEQLRLPKSAVFRITQTLLARGYLLRDDQSQRFSLTQKLLTIGQPQRAERSLVELSLSRMRALRDLTRETVQLGILAGGQGVIIEQVPGLHALRIAVDIGLRFPLHNNAPGKLLLAYASPAEHRSLLRKLTFASSTPRTITRRDDLERECERIVSLGYATDHAEADEGIHCVAAPVFDEQQRLLAALWVSAPARRLPRDSFAATGAQVVTAANQITQAWRG